MPLELGLADIFVILLITIGPLKAAIVFAKLTGNANREFRRQVAFKTVTVARSCACCSSSSARICSAFSMSPCRR